MHAAQGFGYPLPDLDSPMFVSKLVLELEEEDDEDEARLQNEGAQGKPACRSGRGLANRSSLAELSARGKSSRVTMAILQRLTAETYLLHDPAAGTPRQRWQQFLALHEAARRDRRSTGPG